MHLWDEGKQQPVNMDLIPLDVFSGQSLDLPLDGLRLHLAQCFNAAFVEPSAFESTLPTISADLADGWP